MTRQPTVPRKFEFYLKKKDEYNVIFPSEKVLNVSPLHKLIPELIRLSADPEDGDVWNVALDRDRCGATDEIFSFSKRGLQRIAQAAGIVFDPEHTRRTDDARNPRRVEYQATGSIQKPDGTWYTVTHSKEIDLDELEKEERAKLESEARKQNVSADREAAINAEEIERRLRQTMLIWTKHKVAFADTGAHNRVIRSLLILKPFYTSEELSRPFVLPRVSLNVEFMLQSLELKEHLLEGGLTWIWNIFGPRRYGIRPDRSFVTVEEREPRPTARPTSSTAAGEKEGGPV
ncbi:MAG: hypothetical protein ABSE41_14520 [Bacteroidota bacterium]